jgi:pimeloyl-ACP methyl ester carboxylesterase
MTSVPGESSAARWLLRAAAVLGAVGLASAGYQAAAEAADRRKYPPPGRMVDVGGRSLHLIDMGAGSPAVVIVQALGTNALDFLGFYRSLASEARVCVYDRAALGWSDPPRPGRRTHDVMARELHDLLAAAGISPPYVLVGHSLGGIIARRFAVRYPADVAGMVLIDSSHEDQVRRLRAEGRWSNPPVSTVRHALKRGTRLLFLGLYRLLSREDVSDVPPEYAGAARAVGLTSRARRADLRELLLTLRSHGSVPDLGSLPLTVLTAANRDATWNAMQAELATISTESTHIVADFGGHFLQRDNPELVSTAIREMLTRVRQAAPN